MKLMTELINKIKFMTYQGGSAKLPLEVRGGRNNVCNKVCNKLYNNYVFNSKCNEVIV